MEFKDFFDRVKGVDEYNVYDPDLLHINEFESFYPPYFPDKYIGSKIGEVCLKTDGADWVIAVVYLK